jgi:hypothetical protein
MTARQIFDRAMRDINNLCGGFCLGVLVSGNLSGALIGLGVIGFLNFMAAIFRRAE